MAQGSFFGELAMFTSQRRTATARAASDCILFHMSNADFEHVIRDYPKCRRPPSEPERLPVSEHLP